MLDFSARFKCLNLLCFAPEIEATNVGQIGMRSLVLLNLAKLCLGNTTEALFVPYCNENSRSFERAMSIIPSLLFQTLLSYIPSLPFTRRNLIYIPLCAFYHCSVLITISATFSHHSFCTICNTFALFIFWQVFFEPFEAILSRIKTRGTG